MKPPEPKFKKLTPKTKLNLQKAAAARKAAVENTTSDINTSRFVGARKGKSGRFWRDGTWTSSAPKINKDVKREYLGT